MGYAAALQCTAYTPARLHSTTCMFRSTGVLPDIGHNVWVLPTEGSLHMYMCSQATCPEVVLLTLVVRADARRQGMGAALLHALLQHTVQQQQQQQPAEQRVCRVVADVSLANAQAWSFFKKAGFQQGPTAGATAEAVLQLDALQPDMTEPPGGAVGMARGVAAAVMQANRHSGWLAAPVPPPCGQGGLGGRAVHSRHQPQPVVCRQGQQAVRCRERTLRPVTRSLMHMRVSTAAACSAVHYM